MSTSQQIEDAMATSATSTEDDLTEQQEDTTPLLPADGGTSKALTQGEIVFVTLLSFVVLVAICVGAYLYYRRKTRANEQFINNKSNNNSEVGGGSAHQQQQQQQLGTEITVVDIENNGQLALPMNTTEGGAAVANPIHRRCTLDSTGSGAPPNKSRRPSMESDHSGSLGPLVQPRRASQSSMGSNVSANYKLAAIEHMNQISRNGRHD